jgi:hypothetical protein
MPISADISTSQEATPAADSTISDAPLSHSCYFCVHSGFYFSA